MVARLARGFPLRLQFLAPLLLLVAAQEAQAFILKFNVPDSGTIYTTAEVDGFLITSEHFHLRADGLMASTGTTHLDYESGRGRPFTISRVGGGTFSLLDFIGAEGVAEDPEVRPGADTIRDRGLSGRRHTPSPRRRGTDTTISRPQRRWW